MHSASPALMACEASITALSPEPQTLLMVSAGIEAGSPAWISACLAGAWPGATLDHLPHDDLFHLGRIHAGAGDRLADDHGAELGSGERGETAEIAADRGADGGDDDGGGAIAHVVHPVRVGLRANYARSACLSPKLLSRQTCSKGLESKAGGFCGGTAFFCTRVPARTMDLRAKDFVLQGAMVRLRTSWSTRSMKALTGITSCFFPAPRTRSARLSDSASR